MKQFRTLALSVLVITLVTACSEDPPVGNPSLGSINPEVYVAIGNSLTAGYQSGALFEEGQLFSYPNLIAQQIGTPSFVQPLIPYPGTGQLMVLRQITPTPVIETLPATVAAAKNSAYPDPYNNLAIPGAVMADAIDESDIFQRAAQRGNPFYPIVMRDQAAFGKSIVAQAIALQPTLITFWLGNNDAFIYAATGGTRGTDQTGKLPTSPQNFEFYLATALDAIKANLPDTRVLIGNIPDVTENALFNTVPRKIPNPLNPGQLLDIYFVTSDNQSRAAQEGDYVLLTAQAELAKGVGLHPTNPLPSQYVLDAAEVTKVNDAVTAFNIAIERQAAEHGYVVVDLHRFMNLLHTEGVSAAGETYTTDFISGGVFSLDGAHLMPRGSVLVANVFIEAMNRAFGANIRMVLTNDVPGFPAPTGLGKRPVSWTLSARYPAIDAGRIAAAW